MVKSHLKDIREDRRRNRAQRLEFVTSYARWIKRTANSVWSRQQREMLDSVISSANEAAKARAAVRKDRKKARMRRSNR
jgi:hypothetical protein